MSKLQNALLYYTSVIPYAKPLIGLRCGVYGNMLNIEPKMYLILNSGF